MFLPRVSSRPPAPPTVVHKYQRRGVFAVFMSRSSRCAVTRAWVGLCSARLVFIFSPSTRILPELIHQPSPIHTFQNLPFVVVPVDKGQGVRRQTRASLPGRQRPQARGGECSPHGPAELLVGHAAVVLLLPPQLSHGLRFQEPEDALRPVFPLD